MTVPLEDAGVYLRCSADRNDEASVTEQREESAADCEASGWNPLWYEDNDRSASRYARRAREAWERFLADLQAGRFRVVVLWESSRGDRKLAQWAAFLDDCRDRGVLIRIVSARRTYDLSSGADWRALASEGVDNAAASDLTSARVRRNLARAARNGKPHGPVGYGYTRRYDPQTRKLIAQEPSPPESDIAAEIITRIARSDSLTAIKADLEARGIPGATGGGWDRQTMRQIALNPAYAGYRRQPDGSLVGAWAPIVSAEIHQGAVAVLQGRFSARPSRQKHLLSYLARCGCCEDPRNALAVFSSRHGTVTYRCRAHGCVNVAAAWLDELVTLAVCGALAAPDAADLYRSDNSEAARCRAEAAQLRMQLDEWLRAGVSARAYAVKEAEILPRIERAERAAERAAVPLALSGLVGAPGVRAAWDELAIPARRDVIRALMDITVARAADRTRAARTDPGRVIISWKRG